MPSKIFVIDGICSYGKHAGVKANDLLLRNPDYIYWLHQQPWGKLDKTIIELFERCPKVVVEPESFAPDILAFGKHKGRSLHFVQKNDDRYYNWLKTNKFVQASWPDLWKKLHPEVEKKEPFIVPDYP